MLCFSDYFRHLLNYNENKYHIYCVFRIILDTYGIIMKIKIIYIVFFGLFYTLMELLCEINIIYILCFSDYFRHLWINNVNKNHVYCVFRIILDSYGFIMKINIIYIVFF